MDNLEKSNLTNDVAVIFRTVLGRSFDSQSLMPELDLDELDRIETVTAVELAFEIEISDQEWENALRGTFIELVNFIGTKC